MTPLKFLTLNRRIAVKLSGFLNRTILTPNYITSLALFVGVAAGFTMAFGTRRSLIWGALLLQLSFILDYCDGEVARHKRMSSRFGMWFDCSADLAVDLSLWIGLTAGAYRTSSSRVIGVVGALACLGSVLNFVRVLYFKYHPVPVPVSAPSSGFTLKSVMDALAGDDADATFFIWCLAVLGSPVIFLSVGCVYIQILWMTGLVDWFRKFSQHLSKDKQLV